MLAGTNWDAIKLANDLELQAFGNKKKVELGFNRLQANYNSQPEVTETHEALKVELMPHQKAAFTLLLILFSRENSHIRVKYSSFSTLKY